MLGQIVGGKKKTIYSLSKKTGIAYSTLSDIVSGKTDIKSVSAAILYKLSKELNMTMEELYEGRKDRINYYLSNRGSLVTICANGREYSYKGPRNLVGFRHIKQNINNVLYVDAYFLDDDRKIYIEEDYIDLNDIFEGFEELLAVSYEVIIGKPGESRTQFLVDNSIMVSDSMAILYSDNGTEDLVLEVVNLKRNKDRMLIRLNDYEILYTNMSSGMKKRAVEAVRRNHNMIYEEAGELKNA